MSKIQLSGINSVILDIEGTVAPISFVKDTLFPYALRALPDYLAKNWSSPSFQSALAQFPAEARVSPEALVAHVRDLTARDVKVAYLKNLQGTLWREGYEAGELVTPLYGDVIPQIRSWKQWGKQLAIFSSGSVEAQQMFFGHVGRAEGGGQEDLRALFEPCWFDTVNAGPKFEAKSYERIVRELGTECGKTLFLSDHVREIEAALSAGLHALLVIRAGNPAQECGEAIKTVDSLEDVELR